MRETREKETLEEKEKEKRKKREKREKEKGPIRCDGLCPVTRAPMSSGHICPKLNQFKPKISIF